MFNTHPDEHKTPAASIYGKEGGNIRVPLTVCDNKRRQSFPLFVAPINLIARVHCESAQRQVIVVNRRLAGWSSRHPADHSSGTNPFPNFHCWNQPSVPHAKFYFGVEALLVNQPSSKKISCRRSVDRGVDNARNQLPEKTRKSWLSMRGRRWKIALLKKQVATKKERRLQSVAKKKIAIIF